MSDIGAMQTKAAYPQDKGDNVSQSCDWIRLQIDTLQASLERLSHRLDTVLGPVPISAEVNKSSVAPEAPKSALRSRLDSLGTDLNQANIILISMTDRIEL